LNALSFSLVQNQGSGAILGESFGHDNSASHCEAVPDVFNDHRHGTETYGSAPAGVGVLYIPFSDVTPSS
jgi:hypothetical protein